MDINLKDLQHVIISCFIPHKYCEANGNHIFSEAIEKAKKKVFQPGITASRNQGTISIRSKKI